MLELLKNNFSVIALDNLVNATVNNDSVVPESLLRAESLSATKDKMVFRNADCRRRSDLDAVFKEFKINLVIHLAALKSVGESVEMPLEYYQNNFSGTLILLGVMRLYGVKKLIFSSSCTVFGLPQYLPVDEKHPVGMNLTNPYGKSKYFCEQMMEDLVAKEEDWKIIILRYFNPAGAHKSGLLGEDPKGPPNNLFPSLSQIAVGRLDKLKIYGGDYLTKDGTGVRDYLHVVDVALAHLNAINMLNHHPNNWSGLRSYNLSTCQPTSVLDVVRAFEAASGKKIPYEIAPRRTGDIAGTWSATSLAEAELGWKAKFNLNDMCEDFWRFQVQNPNGYESSEKALGENAGGENDDKNCSLM